MPTRNYVISIITPVLNGERYLRECLESVISQFDCIEELNSVEHIVIDGGSSDNSLNILKEYSSQYSHIRWISEQDSGQSEAMNKGINLSRGRLIGFLNVDDYYEQGVFGKVIGQLDVFRPPAFIVANCNIWGEGGKIIAVNQPGKITYFRMLFGQNVQPYPVNPSAYFYHTHIHDLVGGYDVEEHFSLDIDMLFKIIRIANVYYYDEIWGNYRLQPGTKTYDEYTSGRVFERIDKLIRKYQNNLPLVHRVWFFPLYKFLNSDFFQTIKYFINHPRELFPRIMKRIVSYFRPR